MKGNYYWRYTHFSLKNHDYGRKGKSGWLAATQTNDATTGHPLVSEFTHPHRPSVHRTSSHHEASAKPWEKPESLSGQPQLATEKKPSDLKHLTIWPIDFFKRFGEFFSPLKSNIDTPKMTPSLKGDTSKNPQHFGYLAVRFRFVYTFPVSPATTTASGDTVTSDSSRASPVASLVLVRDEVPQAGNLDRKGYNPKEYPYKSLGKP